MNAFLNLQSKESIGEINWNYKDGFNESWNTSDLYINSELDLLQIYFEVEILDAGFSDEIMIGVTTTK